MSYDESEVEGLDTVSRFVRIACHSCGIHFFIPQEFYTARRASQTPFFCPSKHAISIIASPKQQSLQTANREVLRLTAANDQIETENRILKDKLAAIEGNNPPSPDNSASK